MSSKLWLAVLPVAFSLTALSCAPSSDVPTSLPPNAPVKATRSNGQSPLASAAAVSGSAAAKAANGPSVAHALECDEAAKRLIHVFWEGDAHVIRDKTLCQTRRREQTEDTLKRLVVQNVTAPAGPIKSISSITLDYFEKPMGLTQINIAPPENPAKRHEQTYTVPPLQRYWQVVCMDRRVLVATTVVQENGQYCLQAISFKTEHLGYPLLQERSGDRARVASIIALMQKRDCDKLEKEYLGARMSANYSSKQFKSAIYSVSKGLKELDTQKLSLTSGWSWNAPDARVDTYNYTATTKTGQISLRVHFNAANHKLEGFTWADATHDASKL